jgi:negative regulator of flagellin synthesis FlgM
MSINGVGSSGPVYGSYNVGGAGKVQTGPAESTRGSDKVELSGVGGLLAKLKTNDIRTDKVADIRAQLDAGTYETDDKLDGAVDKLLSDLA